MTPQNEKAESQILKKPSAIVPDLENVPEYLRSIPHWIVWRYELVEGKYRKVPYCPATERKAKTNDKKTWCEFWYTRNIYESHRTKYDGAAIVASQDDDLVLIDLDHHLYHNEETSEFELSDFAREWIEAFQSYTEISPSETGIHIIIRGKLPANIRHKVASLGLEVYDMSRSLAITGRLWDQARGIEPRQEVLDRLIEAHLKREEVKEHYPPERLEILSGTPEEILKKAFASSNGGTIERLYQGDTSSYGDDDSSADMAFCGKMAFWVGGDAYLLDRIFRSSRLMREKWDKRHYADGRTYGEVTIARAIASCRQFYQWNRPVRTLVGGTPKSRPARPEQGLPAAAATAGEEDFSDFIGGEEPVQVQSDGVQPKWDEPIPFDEKQLPPFPVHVLPEYMRQFATDLSETTQTPPELACTLLVTAAAGAVHGKVAVNVKPGWYEHLTLYSLTVAPSGSRKSAVFKHVMQPFIDRETYLRDTERPVVERNKKRKAALDSQYKKIIEKLQNPKDDKERAEFERQLEAVDKEISRITKLNVSRIFAENVTTERLMTLLGMHEERLMIASPEGDVFKLIAGMYNGSKQAGDLSVYLKGFDAEWLRVDRQDQERTVILNHPSLAIALSVQPSVIEKMAREVEFLDRGLVQRFLFAIVPDVLGYRKVENIPDINSATYDKYRISMRKLLEMDFARDRNDRPGMHKMTFSPNAQKRMTEFQMKAEEMLKDRHVPDALREWRSKLPGKVARLAAALHLMEHVEAPQYGIGYAIDEETINAAIELGRYYVDHVEAAFRIMAADKDRAAAINILGWIRENHMMSFTKRNILRGMRRAFRNVDELAGPLRLLYHFGYVMKDLGGDERRMVQRSNSQLYLVNPHWLAGESVNKVNPGGDK